MYKCKRAWPIWLYEKYFEWLGACKAHEKGVALRPLHTSLLIVFFTSFMLLGHMIIAIYTMKTPLAACLVILFTMLHFMTPFLFRLSANLSLVVSVGLGVGLLNVANYAVFSQGFSTHIVIWCALLPLIAALCIGRRSALLWTAIVALFLGSLIRIESYGILPLGGIDSDANRLMEAFTVYGWMLACILVLYMVSELQAEVEGQLRSRNETINHCLSVITHDVSNSLSVLNSATYLYQRSCSVKPKERSSKEVEKLFQKMNMACSSIGSVISSVQALKESKRRKMSESPAELGSCLQSCKRLLQDQLKEKKIELKIELGHAANEVVAVDSGVFTHHILMNALINAIKFSYENSLIRVSAEVIGKRLVLSVRDCGVGMETSQIKALYEGKVMQPRFGTRGERGTGLGLLIMKKFLDVCGAKLMIYSRKSAGNDDRNGTEVRMIFPRCLLARASQANDTSPSELIMKSSESYKWHQMAKS